MCISFSIESCIVSLSLKLRLLVGWTSFLRLPIKCHLPSTLCKSGCCKGECTGLVQRMRTLPMCYDFFYLKWNPHFSKIVKKANSSGIRQEKHETLPPVVQENGIPGTCSLVLEYSCIVWNKDMESRTGGQVHRSRLSSRDEGCYRNMNSRTYRPAGRSTVARKPQNKRMIATTIVLGLSTVFLFVCIY